MKGYEGYVKAAIEDPYQIYQDSKHLNRRILYRPFILPSPYYMHYLRVAIDYPHKWRRRSKGNIVTVFPCLNIKKGDILIWSKV